jgi:curli biogenesis system outer membrane secretion channel CsgG
MKEYILFISFTLLIISGCASFQSEKPHEVLSVSPELEKSMIDEEFSLRKKVAIGRFTNETRVANSFLNEGSGARERMSRAAADILMAKLTKTNRFILIERQDSVAISNEQAVSNIQKYNIPAEYLILGSISEFGRSTSGNVGLIDRTKKQTAYAKVTLRIVDTRTGMIIFGEEGTGEAYSEVGTVLGMGSQAGYDDTLADKAIDAAISSVIQKVVNKLNHDSWRSYILNKEGQNVYISGGALQGIKIGDNFKVYKRGKVVVNPQTNVPIELPGSQIATIRINTLIPGEVLTELSIAEIVDGFIEDENIDDLYISDK